MKPIQTIQKTIFAMSTSAVGMSASAQHLAGAGAQRQAIEVAATRAAAGWPAGRAAPRRSPPAKMMVAATSRGTNSTNAVAKLRHDWTSASAIS